MSKKRNYIHDIKLAKGQEIRGEHCRQELEEKEPSEQSCHQGQNERKGESVTHTPGPWEVGEDSDVYSHNGANCVAMICGAAERPKQGENKANARLIAAAPELLEACKAMVARCKEPMIERAFKAINQGGMFSAFPDILEAAIAKAEGKN